MRQNALAAAGQLQRSPDSLDGFGGDVGKGREGKGKEKEGERRGREGEWEVNPLPFSPNKHSAYGLNPDHRTTIGIQQIFKGFGKAHTSACRRSSPFVLGCLYYNYRNRNNSVRDRECVRHASTIS